MSERDGFELELADALRDYAEEAPTHIRPTELARHFATTWPHRGTVLGPWRAVAVSRLAWFVLALVGLLAAMVGGMLIVGSQAERDSSAVLPPVGETYECPTGSKPDEPGPVDQARPEVYGWSPMAFDRRAGRLVALAVDESASTPEQWTVETWTFDVCRNTWTRMSPDREPPAPAGRLVYDVDSDLTIGVHYEDWRDLSMSGNVWAYDLEADTWTEHRVARTGALGFYDPVSGHVIAAADPGLWEYDIDSDTWTTIASATPREDVGFGQYVYDASVDRIVVYAGHESAPGTWLFDIRTGSWSRSGAETPVLRMAMWALPTIVYDEAAERTVVAADNGWGAYDATNDRWAILAGAGSGTPAVYDPVNRRLIVFGGGVGDLEALDLVTGESTVLLEASTAPTEPLPE